MSIKLNRLFRIRPFNWTPPGIILGGLILASWLNGCAIPKARPTSATRDRAFIEYWPPAKDSKKLRLAVKDLIDMKGVVTTAGSEFLLKHSSLAKEDAKCLEIARKRGVQFVGKTNLSELAVAVSGLNAYFGTPRNPLSILHLIPGGSSSGSAVAVANNEADVAFGTDTAGSIRFPAACCGIAGLKTTFGLIPLDGVYPIAPTQLDTVGPMAKNVAGLVQGMDLLEGGFSDQYRHAVAAKRSAQQIRIGRLYIEGTDREVDGAVDDALRVTGFNIVNLSPELTKKWAQAQKDGANVASVGAWLYDNKYQHQPQVTIRTKAVLTVGGVRYKTSYRAALRRRAAWKAALDDTFANVDFIAMPTMQNLPPHIPLFGGTVAFEARVLGLQNTQAVNFAGVPALAIPVPIRHRFIPVTSLQLVGPDRSEAALLNAGRLVEDAVKVR
jgi:Asp-tRNA(Asn)/Glu-tRNA(Gln) amidotransferase A subunit family amidase